MFDESNEGSLEGIIDSLIASDEGTHPSYKTRTNEDYKAILAAALNGTLREKVTVGRSGIYLDNRRIDPPREPV